MWISRDISDSVAKNRGLVQIFRGPRQVGKSSLLMRLGPEFKELSLDDLSLRSLAQADPELFLNQFSGERLLIDEIQYAPELMPAIKRRIDLLKRQENLRSETIFRLTGSNQILMDQQIKESLAGRAHFFDLSTLSVHEILKTLRETSIQKILYQGGWPELYKDPSLPVKEYLDAYINSYIEKDIVLSAGIQKSREFLLFLKLLAGRVGQLMNWSQLGNEAGIDAKTVKDWVSVLEKMGILVLIPPYSSNLSSRLVKSPKLYFTDTGLACRLQGWTSAEILLTSPQQGSLFENLVFSELFKLNQNFALGWSLYHWRSRDDDEVDFLIELSNRRFLFIEAKMTNASIKPLVSRREVEKVFGNQPPQLIQVNQVGHQVLGDNVPISKLSDWLLNFDSQVAPLVS